MNNLSWLLYAADVSDNLDWFFFLMMIVAIIGGLIWLAVGGAMSDEGVDAKEWKTWRKVGYGILLPSFFCGVVLGSVVPSKTTVYAIAASEMGEKAINTQTGGKAIRALDAWLDDQIGDKSGNKDKKDN